MAPSTVLVSRTVGVCISTHGQSFHMVVRVAMLFRGMYRFRRLSVHWHIIHGTMGDTEHCWLTIFVFRCPNCGFPRVEYTTPTFPPTGEYLRDLKFGNLKCSRCKSRFQPLALECHHSTVETILKNDFPRRT